MTLVLITPPSQLPLTLDEAKAQAVIDYDYDDVFIMACIAAATGDIDGVNGWLGRALITQTWELRLDRFPSKIKVPLPPLQSVTSITYVDLEGATQTLDPNHYTVLSGREPAEIWPAYGVCWPATRCVPEAVSVRFVAGYGDSQDAIPDLIKHWLKLRVATLLEHREEVITGTIITANPSLMNMLESYRVR